MPSVASRERMEWYGFGGQRHNAVPSELPFVQDASRDEFLDILEQADHFDVNRMRNLDGGDGISVALNADEALASQGRHPGFFNNGADAYGFEDTGTREDDGSASMAVLRR